MTVTAQNAVDAFDAICDVSCHNQLLKARLKKDFNATADEAATAIDAVIYDGLLQMSSIGSIKEL